MLSWKYFENNLLKFTETIILKSSVWFDNNILRLYNDWSLYTKEGNKLSQVKVRDNESFESALRRFKKQTSRDGVIQEVRKREHYEKPSVKRKKKSEAARKRKFK